MYRLNGTVHVPSRIKYVQQLLDPATEFSCTTKMMAPLDYIMLEQLDNQNAFTLRHL